MTNLADRTLPGFAALAAAPATLPSGLAAKLGVPAATEPPRFVGLLSDALQAATQPKLVDPWSQRAIAGLAGRADVSGPAVSTAPASVATAVLTRPASLGGSPIATDDGTADDAKQLPMLPTATTPPPAAAVGGGPAMPPLRTAAATSSSRPWPGKLPPRSVGNDLQPSPPADAPPIAIFAPPPLAVLPTPATTAPLTPANAPTLEASGGAAPVSSAPRLTAASLPMFIPPDRGDATAPTGPAQAIAAAMASGALAVDPGGEVGGAMQARTTLHGLAGPVRATLARLTGSNAATFAPGDADRAADPPPAAPRASPLPSPAADASAAPSPPAVAEAPEASHSTIAEPAAKPVAGAAPHAAAADARQAVVSAESASLQLVAPAVPSASPAVSASPAISEPTLPATGALVALPREVAAGATHAAVTGSPDREVSPAAPPLGQIAAALSPAGASAPLILRLNPETLGALRIQISQPTGGAPDVRLVVEQPHTLRLLMDDMPGLHRALDDAGVASAGRTVSLQLGSPEAVIVNPVPTSGSATGFTSSGPAFGAGGQAAGQQQGSQGFGQPAGSFQQPRRGADDASAPGATATAIWSDSGIDITA